MILTRDDFAIAVRKVFDNAFLYNKPQDDVYERAGFMNRSHVMAKTLSEIFEKDFMQMTRRIYEAEPEPSSPIYSNKVQRHSVVPRSRQRQRQRLAKGKNAKKVKGKSVSGKSGHRNDVNEEYMKMKNQMNALQSRVDQMKEQMLAMGLKLPSSDTAPPMSVEEKKVLSQEINQFTAREMEKRSCRSRCRSIPWDRTTSWRSIWIRFRMRRCGSCRNMSKSAMLEDMEESGADTLANLIAIWVWGI